MKRWQRERQSRREEGDSEEKGSGKSEMRLQCDRADSFHMRCRTVSTWSRTCTLQWIQLPFCLHPDAEKRVREGGSNTLSLSFFSLAHLQID